MTHHIALFQLVPTPGGVGEQAPGWVLPHPIGAWHDPDDGSYVGCAPDIVTLTSAELLARAQDIHTRHPITDPSTGAPYTDAALEQAVTDWISAAGGVS
jgi:hypothetical protein